MDRAASRSTEVPARHPTRERILAAARVLFAEHGYAKTSVRMIARDVGMSDPAIHYHFPTKQALYEALLVPPDYGSLPLDRLPLSRTTMVDQVMHVFGWWTGQRQFGQMLLRELLASEATSIAFIRDSHEAWRSAVTDPLSRLLGYDAEDTSEMLFDMLAGVFWDAILTFGDDFAESVGQDFFQRRVRAMVDLAMPGERRGSP